MSGSNKITVDLKDERFTFLFGHMVNNNVVFPATGYIWLVWKTFSLREGLKTENNPVILENIRFDKGSQFPETQVLEFSIDILPNSGAFQISVQNDIVCTGNISKLQDPEVPKLINFKPILACNTTSSRLQYKSLLYTDDFYKEAKLNGFNYTGLFRNVQKVDMNFQFGSVKWQDNWIAYLDTLLQILSPKFRVLSLPVRIQKVVIHPSALYSALSNNNVDLPFEVCKYRNRITAPGAEFCYSNWVQISSQRHADMPSLFKSEWCPFVCNQMEHDVTDVSNLVIQILLDNVFTHNIKFVCYSNQANCSSETVFKISFATMQRFCAVEACLVSDGKLQHETACHENLTSFSFEEVQVTPFYTPDILFIQSKNIHTVASIVSNSMFVLVISFEDDTPVDLKNGILFPCAIVAQRPGYTLYRVCQSVLLSTMFSLVELHDQRFEWIEALKQKLDNSELNTRIVLYTTNPRSGIQGFVKCLMKEGYLNVQCVHVKDCISEIFNLEHSSINLLVQLNADLKFNIYFNGRWGCTTNVFLNLEDITSAKTVTEAFVNIGSPGNLSSLEWAERPIFVITDVPQQVCEIHYSALNFRDIMLATGKLHKNVLPAKLQTQESVLGSEFAGMLRQNGKAIFGMGIGGCLSTSVNLNESFCYWEVPKSWSVVDSATVPVAYSTAYYALVVRGNIKNGETILIHAGAGGVGQASIAIALSKNCRVITTVSSDKKRKFLLERFPELTEECFCNSRSASSFEDHVLKFSKGKGVNLILNSLAGDKLHASIRCLARFGRFLEIGKVDLSNNSNLGMEIFLKSVQFHGILLEDVSDEFPQELLQVKSLVSQGIQSGVVKPLNYNLYPHDKVEEAFKFMASGNHIGKVVISLGVAPDERLFLAIPRCYFNPNKIYIVIGGTGGMGMEICNWMIKRGAKKLLLTSRSGVTTAHQAYQIKTWEDQGSTIYVETIDASSMQGANRLLEQAAKIGPVGGIFNFAAVLMDALFVNQTSESFELVSSAKIGATTNLDLLSRSMIPSLDYFVVFSSITANFGTAGQTNYGLANSFMERICEQRRKDGLHGLAIQWGPVDDVGVWHNLKAGKEEDATERFAPQGIYSCLELLDSCLNTPNAVITSFVPNSAKRPGKNHQESLTENVARILGIMDIEKVNLQTPLLELGMDSLSMVQVKQIIESRFNDTLPSTVARSLSFQKLKEMENSGRIDKSGNIFEGVLDFNQAFKLASASTYPLVQMKSKQLKSDILFVVPAVDGFASSVEDLMKEVDFVVYGFQCTGEAPVNSIPDLAKYYIGYMNTIQTQGPFNLVGYSYGAAVAIEMAIQLERGGNKLGQLILFDGSHLHTPWICDRFANFYGVGDLGKPKWCFLFIFMYMSFNAEQIKAQILALSTWETQLQKASEIVREAYPKFSNQAIKELILTFTTKMIEACSYKPSSSLNCKTTLLQATKAGYAKSLGDDYGLNEICKTAVDIIKIPGKHRCFQEEAILLGIPSILNNILSSTQIK